MSSQRSPTLRAKDLRIKVNNTRIEHVSNQGPTMDSKLSTTDKTDNTEFGNLYFTSRARDFPKMVSDSTLDFNPTSKLQGTEISIIQLLEEETLKDSTFVSDPPYWSISIYNYICYLVFIILHSLLKFY